MYSLSGCRKAVSSNAGRLTVLFFGALHLKIIVGEFDIGSDILTAMDIVSIRKLLQWLPSLIQSLEVPKSVQI